MPEPDLKDYYRILQVHPQASPEVIKAAFKRLALMYHPDQNVYSDAGNKFIEIKEAYDVLGTPYRRQQYDRMRVASSTPKKIFDPDSTEEKVNSPRKSRNTTWLWSLLLGIIMLIGAGYYYFSGQLFGFQPNTATISTSLSTPLPLPRLGSVQPSPTIEIIKNSLLPTLGVTYLQVFNAYIKLGDFEFYASPETLPNQQVRMAGGLTPGRYKSSVSVLTEGFTRNSGVELCRAVVVAKPDNSSEDQLVLRYLKQMPVIITPSWPGNEWLAQGLIDADKAVNKRSFQQTNYYGILIGWEVDMQTKTLTLSFDSACSSN
jgi:hypothetical protein